MSAYRECPSCERRAKQALSSNWFPLYRCADCKVLFCHASDCGTTREVCPSCGSDDTSRSAHDVYA